MWSVGYGGGPAEAGEFAGDRDGRDASGLAAFAEPLAEAVQSAFGPVGDRFRRILTRWEKRADTYLAMLHLACGLITWRAADWEPLSE